MNESLSFFMIVLSQERSFFVVLIDEMLYK